MFHNFFCKIINIHVSDSYCITLNKCCRYNILKILYLVLISFYKTGGPKKLGVTNNFVLEYYSNS